MANKTCVFSETGEAISFDNECFFPSIAAAYQIILDNTGLFQDGEILAVIDFEDHVCRFVELRAKMVAVQLKG